MGVWCCCGNANVLVMNTWCCCGEESDVVVDEQCDDVVAVKGRCCCGIADDVSMAGLVTDDVIAGSLNVILLPLTLSIVKLLDSVSR